MKNFLFLIILILFQSCFNNTQTPSIQNKDTIVNSVPDSVINLIRDTINSDTIIFSKISDKWKYEWNYYISSEINNNKEFFIDKDSLYYNDLIKLSSNYYSLKDNQKYAFWTLLIASIAKFESNFDPNCRYREDASLNYIYSEGLMQLSYGDETRYNIPLSTEKQNILDPEINLRSGTIIFAKQLKIRKVIFPSRYFYWSVLTNKENDIIEFFKKNSVELNFNL